MVSGFTSEYNGYVGPSVQQAAWTTSWRMTMHQILPAWPLLAAFLIASLVLAVTPGPGVFYIVTRTLAQGRRAGLGKSVV